MAGVSLRPDGCKRDVTKLLCGSHTGREERAAG